MKKNLILFLFVCLFASMQAQNSTELGLDFCKKVYATSFSPKKDYALVMFRERNKKDTDWKSWGEISLVRMSDKKIVWTESFNYSDGVAWCTSRGVLVVRDCQMTMKDRYNGAPIWTGTGEPVFIDEASDILLTYGYTGGTKVHGCSIRDGSEYWTARIPASRSWGWNDVVWEDSAHIVVVNDNVSRINLYTGEVDTYEAKTGINDVGKILTDAVGAIALTVTTNVGNHSNYYYYYVPSTYPPRIIAELHSNLLRSDSCYFFSDRNNIVKLDRYLNPIWTTPLPERTASHAVLYFHGSTVYMANLGYGLKGKNERNATGRPFVAAFDAETGEQRFLRQLSKEKCMADSATFAPQGCTVYLPDSVIYTPFH